MLVLLAPKKLVELLTIKSDEIAYDLLTQLDVLFVVTNDTKRELKRAIYSLLSSLIYVYLASGSLNPATSFLLVYARKNEKLNFGIKLVVEDNGRVIIWENELNLKIKFHIMKKALYYQSIVAENLKFDEIRQLLEYLDGLARFYGVAGNNARERIKNLSNQFISVLEPTLNDIVLLAKKLSNMLLNHQEFLIKKVKVNIFQESVLKDFKYSRRSPIRDMKFEFEKIAKRS